MVHSFTGLVNCLEALPIRALNKIHNALDEGRWVDVLLVFVHIDS